MAELADALQSSNLIAGADEPIGRSHVAIPTNGAAHIDAPNDGVGHHIGHADRHVSCGRGELRADAAMSCPRPGV